MPAALIEWGLMEIPRNAFVNPDEANVAFHDSIKSGEA
jgi:hypothetical protein